MSKLITNIDGTYKNEFCIGLGDKKICIRRNGNVIEYNIDGNWYKIGEKNTLVVVADSDLVNNKIINLQTPIQVENSVELYYNGIYDTRFSIINNNQIELQFDFDVNDTFVIKYS